MRNVPILLIIAGFTALVFICCSQPSSGESNDSPPSASGPAASGPGEYTEPGTSSDFWKPPEDRKPRFVFIHHSTGSGFMFDGGMSDMLKEAGFEVHSRTYGDGWIGDNTNPDHFPTAFTERFDDMISWDLNDGEHYDIIAFKSCYPASNIRSDEKLDQYKEYYATVKTVTSQHPEILFIPWSTPPLVPKSTESNCANRAREFADWLTGDYIEGETNLAAYDVFNVLAGNDPNSGDYNCLRFDYQKNESDSHPNHDANVAVAEDFTNWLSGLVRR